MWQQVDVSSCAQMWMDLGIFVICAAMGLWWQRQPSGERWRQRLWSANFTLLIPAAAIYTFLAVRLEPRLAAVAMCGVVAWWCTLVCAYAYARVVAPSHRPRRGALAMIGAFPNTGFLGFPLAYMAFGHEGLRWAVLYDLVGLVIPAVAVSAAIAASHTSHRPDDEPRGLLRSLLLNPPLWASLGTVLARVLFVEDPVQLDWLGTAVGQAVGPMGFLLLGLSVPLHGFSHDAREVGATLGAVLVRIALAPLILLGVGRVAGVDLPGAMYLIAAMPTAFHVVVLTRVYGLEASVVRLGVLVSTSVVVLAVLVGHAVL